MIPTFPMTSQINQAMETIQRCADQLPDGWKLTIAWTNCGSWMVLSRQEYAVCIPIETSNESAIVCAVREARRRAGLDDGIPK